MCVCVCYSIPCFHVLQSLHSWYLWQVLGAGEGLSFWPGPRIKRALGLWGSNDEFILGVGHISPATMSLSM